MSHALCSHEDFKPGCPCCFEQVQERGLDMCDETQRLRAESARLTKELEEARESEARFGRENAWLGDHNRLARERAEASEAREKALATVVEAFARTAEAAISHAERPKRGMQVPFHGDFCNAPPSTLDRLAWWVREMRAALASKPGGEG